MSRLGPVIIEWYVVIITQFADSRPLHPLPLRRQKTSGILENSTTSLVPPSFLLTAWSAEVDGGKSNLLALTTKFLQIFFILIVLYITFTQTDVLSCFQRNTDTVERC